MNDLEYKIRPMTLDDYDEVYALWMQIHGFGIRSIDDSREGFEEKSYDQYGGSGRGQNCRSNPVRT